MTTSSRQSADRRAAGVLGALLFAGLFLTWAAGAARADEPLSFKEKYERAVTTFKSGQYDKAIEQFQELYQEKPVPILLFNLAQAHRKATHYKEALDLYERFMREDPKNQLQLSSETDGYINDMKAALAAQEEAKDKAAKVKADHERDLALAKALAEEPAPAGYQRTGERIRPPAIRPLRIVKWTAAAAGVLAVAAGASLLAINGRPTCPLAPGQELCPQQLDTFAGGIAGVAAGGALLAGAVAAFVLDYKKSQELTLGPTRLPLLAVDYHLSREGAHTALVTLSGRF